MKIKFWIEHSPHCAYYHTSETIDIPDEMLSDDLKKAFHKESNMRIDDIVIVED